MNWKLPNQLTVGRVVLAAAFFVLLALYDQGGSPASGRILLNAAFILFILAGVTDVLDGYIARRWNLTSAFGRIVDPFVDKVLVVGAFVMFTGSNFVMNPPTVDPGAYTSRLEQDLPFWLTGHMITAVQAWMAVAIMVREFVVSAVRGYSESCGVEFPATSAGKIKMFLQSVAVGVVLYQLANLPHTAWAVYLKIATVWLAVLVSVFSGFVYIRRARNLLTETEHEEDVSGESAA